MSNNEKTEIHPMRVTFTIFSTKIDGARYLLSIYPKDIWAENVEPIQVWLDKRDARIIMRTHLRTYRDYDFGKKRSYFITPYKKQA